MLAAIMSEKYKVPFYVIRNIAPSTGIYLNENSVDFRENVLFYQGALNAGRGLETLIKAMVQLPDWQLWLAGEGDITQQLKDQTATLGLDKRIKFLGWVMPGELPAYYDKARISINLREKGSLNDYYSLPNKFFDAIHAGLPSINMDYPEYRAICAVYPCSILIGEVTVDAIVGAIVALQQNPEKIHAMITACRDAARELTWEKEAAKLIAYYHQLRLPLIN